MRKPLSHLDSDGDNLSTAPEAVTETSPSMEVLKLRFFPEQENSNAITLCARRIATILTYLRHELQDSGFSVNQKRNFGFSLEHAFFFLIYSSENRTFLRNPDSIPTSSVGSYFLSPLTAQQILVKFHYSLNTSFLDRFTAER